MLESFALSDTGRVREKNEDYCRAIPEMGLYLLADGMGGAKGGATASRLAVDTITELIEAAPLRDSDTLVKAVKEANRRVLVESSRDPRLEGMGTTLVAALEVGNGAAADLAIASVGDSRAYLFDENGLAAITEDQTWVHEVGRPLGLDENSLRTHPMRHVLTMAIGVSSNLTIRCYMVQLPPSSCLLLSSDGLHGVVEPEAIEKILRESTTGNSTLEQKCKQLIEAAREAGGPDNITAVLIRSGGSPHSS